MPVVIEIKKITWIIILVSMIHIEITVKVPNNNFYLLECLNYHRYS